MPGKFEATLELLSRDADNLNFRATVTKDKGQPDNAIVRVIAEDGFAYYSALPVLDEGVPHDFATPAPAASGTVFLWLWPDTTTPVSNTVEV